MNYKELAKQTENAVERVTSIKKKKKLGYDDLQDTIVAVSENFNIKPSMVRAIGGWVFTSLKGLHKKYNAVQSLKGEDAKEYKEALKAFNESYDELGRIDLKRFDELIEVKEVLEDSFETKIEGKEVKRQLRKWLFFYILFGSVEIISYICIEQ